jgi:CheY-like chemotaxis protein
MADMRREQLLRALPYARRYARALTGSQAQGDPLVSESLSALLATDAADDDPRIALYAGITRVFDRAAAVAAAAVAETVTPTAGTPKPGLSLKQRQLLLLTSLEECSPAEAGFVVGLDVATTNRALRDALTLVRQASATDVLIIEDEPIIAMDIEELVRGCGHRVVGVASTETDAIAIAERDRPGLILADINLGAGGDGSAAVARIIARHDIPVIFVTAYPERLLTGEAVEPAFLITKPFEPLTLAIATYQAVTGGVHTLAGMTETA